MRIKPVYEATARANDNQNLVFVAVNCDQARDCSMSFGIRGIPTFIGFLNGQKHKEFSGANEQMLNATIAELK
jgi:thiol-disulfide isomerase/thioredoxin